MQVSISLFADLRQYGPQDHDGPLVLDVADGTTVEQLLGLAGLPEDEAIRGEVTVGLNGGLGKRDSVLSEGDDILLFSPMEGG